MLDHDSQWKDYISFIDIRNRMIQSVMKKLVLKQSECCFFTVVQSTLKTGVENINGWLRNAKDLEVYSWLYLVGVNLHPS